MTTAALDHLWTYLKSLDMTERDRQWLAGKLSMPDPTADYDQKYHNMFCHEANEQVRDEFILDYKAGNAHKDCISEEQLLQELNMNNHEN